MAKIREMAIFGEKRWERGTRAARDFRSAGGAVLYGGDTAAGCMSSQCARGGSLDSPQSVLCLRTWARRRNGGLRRFGFLVWYSISDERLTYGVRDMNGMEDVNSDGGLSPTIRIGILDAAKREPISVKPDAPLNVATTIMQLKDFSQLPVMENKRDVKGVVSWKSISARILLGRDCESVRHCMDPAQVIDSAMPLLDAVDVIRRHDYVLVRDKTKTITGIITASDVAQEFMQLTTQFLLIREIEGRLRHLIKGKFSTEQLSASQNVGSAKPIEGPTDMTFGGYIRLLQNKEHWDRLGLSIDRKEFLKRLDSVREIRNEVMHFDPEGLDSEQKRKLEEFAKFFRYLESIGAV